MDASLVDAAPAPRRHGAAACAVAGQPETGAPLVGAPPPLLRFPPLRREAAGGLRLARHLLTRQPLWMAARRGKAGRGRVRNEPPPRRRSPRRAGHSPAGLPRSGLPRRRASAARVGGADRAERRDAPPLGEPAIGADEGVAGACEERAAPATPEEAPPGAMQRTEAPKGGCLAKAAQTPPKGAARPVFRPLRRRPSPPPAWMPAIMRGVRKGGEPGGGRRGEFARCAPHGERRGREGSGDTSPATA